MPKYLIKYGWSHNDDYEEVIEAESLEEAESIAYDMCIQEMENRLTWSAEEIDED